MSAFQDIIRADIGQVFLNLDEFGSIHTIDGRKMSAVVDDVEVIEREKRQIDRIDGIYRRQFIIYVAAAAFGRLPAVGRKITFDGGIYQVADATREEGVYAITLGANGS